jgi:hypothetical protein
MSELKQKPVEEKIITKEYIMNNYANLSMDQYLFSFQFTEDELKCFIDSVTMKRVLITQKNLSVDFVCDYILNSSYHVNDSDEWLSWDDVMYYQPHISEKDLLKKTTGGTD